ncbi:MAG: hypothetical protein HY901_05285 [Deltaproteobacteria bacterium]|nr:hypothetical protein [Deltaproteobacteria bacterium]
MHPGDFLCPTCELIVDGRPVEENPEAPKVASVIRAMLAPPESSLITKPPAPPPAGIARIGESEGPTRVFNFAAGSKDVPTVVMGLDLRAQPLSSFEAYVVSLIDGRVNVTELGLAAGLSSVELQSVLHTLLAREVIAILELTTDPNMVLASPEPPEEHALPPLVPALPTLDELPPLEPALPPPEPPAKAPAAAPAPARTRAPVARPPAAPKAPAQIPVLTPGSAMKPASPLAPLRPVPAAPPVPIQPGPPLRERVAAKPEPRPSPVGPERRSASEELAELLRQKRQAQRPVDSSVLLLQKAIALERDGKVEEAITVLELGIGRCANPAMLYNRLALALVKERRDFVRAEAMMRKALKLEPGNEVFTQNLMRIVMLSGSISGKKTKPKGK